MNMEVASGELCILTHLLIVDFVPIDLRIVLPTLYKKP